MPPTVAQPLFDKLESGDGAGHWCHLVSGMLFCGAVSSATSAVEIGLLPLLGTAIYRQWWNWRAWPYILTRPIVVALALYVGWVALSLLWTPDLTQGLDELATLRWMAMPLIFTPAIDRRRLMIMSVAIGFMIGLGVQAGHVLGHFAGIEWLTWDRAADRFSGWWDPVVGGSALVAGLGLHLPCAFLGQGRLRVLAITCATITFLGIGATGTRGAWLAALALLGCVALFTLVTVRPRRRLIAPAVIGGIIVLVVATIGAFTIGDSVVRRADLARQEVARALSAGEYDTDTGARVLMARAALDEAGKHPFRGGGAGSFNTTLNRFVAEHEIAVSRGVLEHDHAHNAAIHALTTLGAVGLLLGAVVVVVALRGGIEQWRQVAPYDLGPACALLGLLLAGGTDTIQVNNQTAAIFGLLCALCISGRPRDLGMRIRWGRMP